MQIGGPALRNNKTDVIIAVNWTGVYVVDDEEQVLLELSFPEVTNVILDPSGAATQPTMNGSGGAIAQSTQGLSFQIQTIRGEDFVFQSGNSEDIRELILYFLEGLKKRSRHVIAFQDYAGQEGTTFLPLEKGDLVTLESGGGQGQVGPDGKPLALSLIHI